MMFLELLLLFAELLREVKSFDLQPCNAFLPDLQLCNA